MKNNRVYLDHASTTYLDPQVEAVMEPLWFSKFGNPSSIYEEGRIAKKNITEARALIASLINSSPDEIIFTGGGTESDNLAILGFCRANKNKALRQAQGKPHIITTKIEHHAVLHAFHALEKEGFEISVIGVDSEGIVDLGQLKSALRNDTILVSVMYANNEIGTIQPIAEISKLLREHRQKNQLPVFHTDAIQAAGYLDLNIQKLGVDLMSLNGSKIYGPKGVGVLYVKRGIKLEPLIYGGGQEFNLRSGTENVPGIAGLAKALELVFKNKEEESERLTKLRDMFISEILKTVPDSVLNGSAVKRLPNNVNVSFYGVEGEAAVLYLDEKGISCSTGSACSSSNLEPSHVIMALGRQPEYAHGSLRLTLGKITTKEDIDYVLKILPEIIKKLRIISALDKDYGKKENKKDDCCSR